ncbi:unnamed protein product, partial [Symbiodinium sp. CCMP2592]
QQQSAARSGSSSSSDVDAAEDAEARAVASCSLQCCCLLEAPEKVLTGPGVGAGARRYLGVARPSMMFLWLQQWARENSHPVPSFTTFCRAVRECRGWLKFRKNAGEHAVCDTCWLPGCTAGSVHVLPIAVSVHVLPIDQRPQELQAKAPAASQTLDDYIRHLMLQWQDREADLRWAALSVQLRTSLRMGVRLRDIQRSLSVVLIRADGLDQAKHKCPRSMTKTHGFEALLRPSLSVLMLWAQGHALAFEIKDADVYKNTNSNVEGISRLLDKVYNNCNQALPVHICIVQDNCSRDCKNGLLLSWCVKLHLLQVCERISLQYPSKGHTHGPLDGLGGQAVTKCSACEFSDADSLVGIYDGFLQQSTVDGGASFRGAWKGDEQANWQSWWEEVGLVFSNLFEITTLKDLGYLQDRDKVVAKALQAHREGCINDAARDFLVGWAKGTLRRHPRPAQYEFLNHNRHAFDALAPAAARAPLAPEEYRPIHVQADGGGNLPPGPEDDEADELPE